jgi:hypothetical protein
MQPSAGQPRRLAALAAQGLSLCHCQQQGHPGRIQAVVQAAVALLVRVQAQVQVQGCPRQVPAPRQAPAPRQVPAPRHHKQRPWGGPRAACSQLTSHTLGYEKCALLPFVFV